MLKISLQKQRSSDKTSAVYWAKQSLKSWQIQITIAPPESIFPWFVHTRWSPTPDTSTPLLNPTLPHHEPKTKQIQLHVWIMPRRTTRKSFIAKSKHTETGCQIWLKKAKVQSRPNSRLCAVLSWTHKLKGLPVISSQGAHILGYTNEKSVLKLALSACGAHWRPFVKKLGPQSKNHASYYSATRQMHDDIVWMFSGVTHVCQQFNFTTHTVFPTYI